MLRQLEIEHVPATVAVYSLCLELLQIATACSGQSLTPVSHVVMLHKDVRKTLSSVTTVVKDFGSERRLPSDHLTLASQQLCPEFLYFDRQNLPPSMYLTRQT